MRSMRVLLGTVGAFAILGGASGCGMALASTAASGVWVQVNPSTISPGGTVKVTASCGDNSNSATVSSLAFGSMTLLPQASLLIGQALVPPGTAPGTFAVDVVCKTGSNATTTLTVIGSNAVPAAPTRGTMGPHTGGGYLATGGHDSGSANPAAWIVGGVAAIGTAILISTRRRRPVPARRRSQHRP